MRSACGVYVSLSPKGILERQLVTVNGEISLPETTPEEEIVLYSELNFEPYAAVVDMLRTTAAFSRRRKMNLPVQRRKMFIHSFLRPCGIWWRRLRGRTFFTAR